MSTFPNSELDADQVIQAIYDQANNAIQVQITGASDPSVGMNGETAPTSSTEIGFIDNSGNLRGVSSTNPLPISGNITASNPSVGTTGTTAPTSATELGIIVSGNLQGVSSSNPVPISAATLPLPTGAATNAELVTINTTLGTPMQQTGGTVTANLGTLNGAATAANQTNGTAVTQVSTLPSDATPATQNITVVDSGTTTNTYSNGQVWYTGTPTAGSAASFSGSSSQAGQIEINGTWTGTLQVEISIDGGTTYTPHAIHQIGAPFFVSTFTSNVIGSINLAGKTNVRVRATAAMTGTAVVKLITSVNTSSVYVANAVKLVDGSSSTSTNTLTIKAASTAPLSTDTAAVVALSPNSSLPLPSGAATSANQTNASQKTQIVDGSGNVIASTSNALNVDVTNTSLAVTQATASALNATMVGTTAAGSGASSGLVTVQGNASGTPVPVSGTVTITPSGEQNVNLNQVGGSALSIGQQLSAASLPVVLPATQITSLQNVAQIGGSALALGQATSANSIPVVISSNQVSTVPASRGSSAQVVTPAQQTQFYADFELVLASSVDSTLFTTIQTGSGQTLSQSAGNLVITSGTTANAESIIRSTSSFTGSMLSRLQVVLSQRIANNNFYAELVDVIGDNLTTTVNSATSITVTIPSNPFTSSNVGQFMYVGAVQNISASAVPGRYAIASVSGNNVTFTVAGWPASGSGTCSLFGWNYYQLTYTSTTATSVNYDSQARGWAFGATTASINTTASPGHMAILVNNDGAAYLADQLVASVTGTVETTQRASRVTNLPSSTTPLYLQIRAANGTSAPASTTTLTMGMVSVENYAATAVVVNDVKAQGAGSQLPVAVTNTPAVTVSSGTVTTVSTVTAVTNSTTALPGAQAADVSAVAFTATVTSAAISPTAGCSYVLEHSLSAYTSGSVQVTVQESVDGTEWHNVYSFPPLAATGVYQVSPPLMFNGKQVRYVSSGPTSSLTHTVNRSQMSQQAELPYKSLIDVGSVNGGTLNIVTGPSTTGTLPCEGLNNYSVIVNQGSGGSGAVFQLQGTVDNSNWITLASCTGIVGGATPVTMNYQGVPMSAIRVNSPNSNASATLISITIVANIAQGSVRPNNSGLSDASGTTSSSANTATTILAAAQTRKYLYIQNLSSSATIYINFTTTAVVGQPSIALLPYAGFVQEASFVSPELISAISSTASVPFALKYA